MDTFKKPARLLREIAYDKIKQAILQNAFEPGEFLSESKLIAFLGMSKTPIKSAIDRLESEGFVTVAPKQGIVVTALSIETIRDVFDLRIVLETYVCEQIAGKLNEKQMTQIERNLSDSKQAMLSQDENAFAHADAQFHLLLASFSGNQELHRVLVHYQDHLFRTVLKVLLKDTGRMATSHQDHVAIFNALIQMPQDANRARELMREHLLYGKAILVH